MKRLVFFIIFSFSFSVFAEEFSFEVQELDGVNIIIEKSTYQTIPLQMVSPDQPKILKIQESGNLFVIYYFAGTAGTFNLVGHEKAVIFDSKIKRFIEKTYTTKFEGLDDQAQPKFSVIDGKIEYILPK